MTREPDVDRKARGSTATWVWVCIVVALSAYFAGYYFGSPQTIGMQTLSHKHTIRFYRSDWMCRFFIPAAWLEAEATTSEVSIARVGTTTGVTYTASPERLRR